jgi:hypothetical protein
MPVEIWLLGTAVVFTIVGYKMGTKSSIEQTIDALIDQGYLRHKKDSKGDIEILKWNDLTNSD